MTIDKTLPTFHRSSRPNKRAVVKAKPATEPKIATPAPKQPTGYLLVADTSDQRTGSELDLLA